MQKNKILRSVLSKRLRQKKMIAELALLPIDENISLLRKVLKGENSIEEFLHHSKQMRDYYKKAKIMIR